MKRINSIIIGSILLIGSLTAIVAANTITPKSTNATIDLNEKSTLDPRFYAQISFLLSEGEGCGSGCIPIRQVPIWAEGLTTDHNATGITDDNGICILELEFDQNYRIHIEFEGFHRVLFDFTVNEDQAFTFHMKQKKVPVPISFPRISQLIQQIENIKTALTI
jgi:hypothetical protein